MKYERADREKARRRGQLTVEYAVMFVAIVAAVIYAATNIVKPSVNRLFVATGNVIDREAHDSLAGSRTR